MRENIFIVGPSHNIRHFGSFGRSVVPGAVTKLRACQVGASPVRTVVVSWRSSRDIGLHRRCKEYNVRLHVKGMERKQFWQWEHGQEKVKEICGALTGLMELTSAAKARLRKPGLIN